MKLKIRVDSDDLLMFVIFAIFLLYIVAIVVGNLGCFAQEGYFVGPNPLPAFSGKYIASTIGFYILALAACIIGSKSTIFDFDKGIGITTDKKDKGYSRWAKEKEIIGSKAVEAIGVKEEKSKSGGTPLIYKGDQIYVDNGENHTLVIGATGSGKTQSVILPTVKVLAKHRESMVITDPKGEIYEKTSEMLRAKGYQILLLNFRDPQNGSAWNPMDLPYKMYKSGNQDKAIELLDDLALNILYDASNKNADPFWEKTSADYFSGLALGLFEDAKEDQININSISLMSNVGEDKFGGSTYIKEYFNNKSPESTAYINASSTINAPTDTKGSILSVFKQKIKLFASRENLSEMLSHSDVDLSSIGKQPTAVFIVIQDEKKTYHSLVTILLKQIYETLIGVAQENNGKLPVRTNFLLDEFANMPPLKDVTTMITAARSRQIRFTMIIQNFAQLDAVYGKEEAETLRGNCGNLIYLVTTELKALEEISKMCGEEKSKKDDKTASRPLVTISDLQHMKENDVIIMRLRMNPFKTHFTPDWKLDWGEKYPKAEYPSREKSPVHTFDLKEFVKAIKKKKLMEMMNSSDGAAGLPNPLGGGLPNMPNPFLANGRSNPFDTNAKIPNPLGTMSGGLPSGMGMPNPFSLPNMGAMPGAGMPNPFANKSMPASTPLSTMPSMPGMNNSVPSFDQNLGDMGGSKNPFGAMESNGGNINLDELVKKIDKKIAELEEEEKRNTEEEQKKKGKEALLTANTTFSAKSDIKDADSFPSSSVKQDTKVSLQLNEDDDDDDFFDDFFDN